MALSTPFIIAGVTYCLIAVSNMGGVVLFPGLLSDFGLIVWFTVIFFEYAIARL